MTDDDFSPPPPKVKISEFEGQLLLITATEILHNIPSDYAKDDSGRADVTVVDLVVIDANGRGTPYEGLWVFQGALQGTLRTRVGTGRKTLTRLVKGASQKGDFQWTFADPTEQDRVLARMYLAGLTASVPATSSSGGPAAYPSTQSYTSNQPPPF